MDVKGILDVQLCYKCQQDIDTPDWRCPHCQAAPSFINNYFCFAAHLSEHNDGFNAEDYKLMAISKEHFWFKARNNLIIHGLKQYGSHATNYLEIGCGTGIVISEIQKNFPQWQISGTDIHLSALSYTQDKLSPETPLLQMDARFIPFRNHFDTIGAFDVLEHIQDDEAVIQQIYQALESKGIFIVTVPQHAWLWSAADVAGFHKRRYRRNELETKLKKAGFIIEFSTSFMFFLLPFMYASRFFRLRPYNLKNELIIPPFLNFIFEKILKLEFKCITAGLRFPIGGTRVIVARKNSK